MEYQLDSTCYDILHVAFRRGLFQFSLDNGRIVRYPNDRIVGSLPQHKRRRLAPVLHVGFKDPDPCDWIR